MTNAVFEREMRASEALRAKLRSQDGLQFDGDPHWDRAMEALAQEAVRNAERRIAEAAKAGSASES